VELSRVDAAIAGRITGAWMAEDMIVLLYWQMRRSRHKPVFTWDEEDQENRA